MALELDVVLAAIARVLLTFAGRDAHGPSGPRPPPTPPGRGRASALRISALAQEAPELALARSMIGQRCVKSDCVCWLLGMDPHTHRDPTHVSGVRVRLLTGHTRQLLPRLRQPGGFAAVFLDVWGSQYAEVLAPWQRMRGQG